MCILVFQFPSVQQSIVQEHVIVNYKEHKVFKIYSTFSQSYKNKRYSTVHNNL